MPRIKTPKNCIQCEEEYYPWQSKPNSKFCSKLCACRNRNTPEHQRIAGRAGAMVIGNKTRGTGTKGYIKVTGQHEHRRVMEKILGRKLTFQEVVHHKDNNKHNNDPDNL